ncbi:hypothetical protein KGY58_05235 [Candidatus Bipolaricaulota bacterium]|nr:hypothetical protein [Candidatus Bipolaricaulota bacterium]
MKVVRVTEGSEVRDFIRFPYKLYNEGLTRDSLWAPPMKTEIKSALDPDEHPFYKDPDSDAQAFIVKRNESVEGRIMVLESGSYNREHQEETGFFYFFESKNDQEVADKLFDSCRSWARERDLKTLTGPMGMLAGDGHGILVDGFNRRPGMGMAWNPPYYKSLVEGAGFEKLADSFSARALLDFEEKKDRLERLSRAAERIKKKSKVKVESFDSRKEVKDQMDWVVPQMSTLYNESFKNLPYYHPMDEVKMRRIINRLLTVTNSRSIKLIKLAIQDDRIVGFLLAYPNIVSGLKKAQGDLWPLGWLYLQWDRRFTRWADANGIGILPEFQGTGVSVLLYLEFLKTLEESQFEKLIINQISEKNHKNLREIQKTFGVEFDRKHRIYRQDL